MYLSVDSLHKNESVIYNKHLLKIIIFIPYATKDPVGFISSPLVWVCNPNLYNKSISSKVSIFA